MSILVWIITGIIAGWLAGLLIRGAGFGLIGGLLGGWLAGMFGVQPTSWLGMVVVAAIGGAILVWILHLIHPGIA